MAASYELTAQNITDTTAEILVTDAGIEVEAVTVDMTGGIASATTNASGVASFTGLAPSTSYTASVTSGNTFTTTFTTKATGYDNPKTATQEQWENLATRIKAKANASDVPTITMTNVDPGEGSALLANNYIAVYGGDPIIMDYSLLEVNTGAKWIDGSAIYKKTINFGTLPASGNRTVAHSVSNLAYIVDIKAMAYDTGSSRYKALNLPQGNNTDWIVMEADGTNVYAYVGSDFSDTTAYVTLYYTKSS